FSGAQNSVDAADVRRQRARSGCFLDLSIRTRFVLTFGLIVGRQTRDLLLIVGSLHGLVGPTTGESRRAQHDGHSGAECPTQPCAHGVQSMAHCSSPPSAGPGWLEPAGTDGSEASIGLLSTSSGNDSVVEKSGPLGSSSSGRSGGTYPVSLQKSTVAPGSGRPSPSTSEWISGQPGLGYSHH